MAIPELPVGREQLVGRSRFGNDRVTHLLRARVIQPLPAPERGKGRNLRFLPSEVELARVLYEFEAVGIAAPGLRDVAETVRPIMPDIIDHIRDATRHGADPTSWVTLQRSDSGDWRVGVGGKPGDPAAWITDAPADSDWRALVAVDVARVVLS